MDGTRFATNGSTWMERTRRPSSGMVLTKDAAAAALGDAVSPRASDAKV
jgi:hypothetical protein